MLVCKYVRLTRLGVGWGVGEKHVIDVEDEDEVNSYHANNLDALHGADLVVCDEGHRIKNRDAIISMVLKEVKTRRRLVLTGYPLQNNLEEYWCMVDFVRPAFLGSISEFNNMFTQPILNGQCVDSRPEDIKLMKARAYILHHQLEGFVQRRDHSILRAALPPKSEFVIPLKLTELQVTFYKELLTQREMGSSSLFYFYATATKIWNHPDVLFHACHSSGAPKGKKAKGAQSGDNSFDQASIDLKWAKPIFPKDYAPNDLTLSPKFQVTLGIVLKCIHLKEKVLIFSQSLKTLDTMESILKGYFVPNQDPPQVWTKNTSYFRIDGSTTAAERQRLIVRVCAMCGDRKGSSRFGLFMLC
eukprot:m.389419 g.389419  ORF g.389419 m.389419 type:complete len:358 (-) comp21050_c0_seq8:1903-2976(-)